MPGKRLVVLGGGIKGTAVAALAALRGFCVTLIEKQAIGAGTTSTNHGRLHAGTASWVTDTTELMEHRAKAARLMNDLLDPQLDQAPGIYSFENPGTAAAFRSKCEASGIGLRVVNVDWGRRGWVSRPIATAYEVQEYSFDPAALASRMCAVALANGGSLLISRAVQVIRQGRQLVTVTEAGEAVVSDLVVNALSRWSADLSIDKDFPAVSLAWFRWQLLCAPASKVTSAHGLRGVIVYTFGDGLAVSAIGHGDWITLDSHNTPVERIDGPNPYLTDWRRLKLSDPVDKSNFENAAMTFAPIQGIMEPSESCYALFGIHSREIGRASGSLNRIYSWSSKYYLVFGGQASTSLLDATDLLDQLASDGHCAAQSPPSSIAELKAALPQFGCAESVPMRWDS